MAANEAGTGYLDPSGRALPLRAGPHGGDGRLIASQLGIDPSSILDLSASLNPVAPDPLPILRCHLDSLRHYPDDTYARDGLAEAMEVDPARLVLTNGGAEAIALVAAQCVTGWIDGPEFSLYARYLVSQDPQAPRWRSNPNNPTGLLAGKSEVAGVWDEAFYPLATGAWTRGDADLGSIVVGSLTKLLACPGLRSGYVLAPDDETAQSLAARRPQWSVNALVADCLVELLSKVDLPAWRSAIAALREDLYAVLARHGFAARPSDACFVLVEAAWGLRSQLAPMGIIVRDAESFGLPGCVRIAVPDEAGLERLDEALGAIHTDGPRVPASICPCSPQDRRPKAALLAAHRSEPVLEGPSQQTKRELGHPCEIEDDKAGRI
ncbi:MAG: aminotransferase class I/II-fold pyridoxal phosphate-dependent enzyme [Actinobacteria bacterium]|nr:aminotransferase class I/II-fold pyridoxal phosphate-dependent enzyme [Actinomycetota bacterium]